ncbi:MAG: hypothetical protein ACREDM_11220 [Methylocella sp.]
MTHTIETLKELHEQRFDSVDRAIVLAADEIARRLEVLNHYHDLAREKERTFLSREAFETFAQRVVDDLAVVRRENQAAVDASAVTREAAAKSLSDRLLEQTTNNEMRFGKIEAIYARLVGGLAFGAVILPLITGLLVYLLARGQ